MASALHNGEPSGAPAKSKLDNLSRNDLIRFVKKQLEHVRLSKVEVNNLKEQIERKDATIRNLGSEIAALKKAATFEAEKSNHISSCLEKGECVYPVNEDILAEIVNLKSEIAALKKERVRIEDDLNAALATNSELRSKLDDTVQEASALREQQTATDVFSLELKDYEKKMVQLNKSLKEARTALEANNAEKNTLMEQLSVHKSLSDRASTECSTLTAQLQEAKQELADEQLRSTELQSSLNRLQDNFNVLANARNDERVAFEEKLAQNEVLVEVLRKNVEQKQNELRNAINEKDLLKTRLEDLENDYESYKSRARYVLEQKAQSSGDQVHYHVDLSAANEAISDLKRSLELLQLAHDDVLRAARKDRELREKAEISARADKSETMDICDRMAVIREELFNSKIALKERVNECVTYQRHITDLERKIHDESREKTQIIKSLKDELAKREHAESELNEQLQIAKKRYQKVASLLEEWKSLKPVDVTLQTSVIERPAEKHSQSPVEVQSRPSLFDAAEPEIPEETLEDVLFGNAKLSPEPTSEDAYAIASVPALVEEVERLSKNLQHARELLSEAEATNATLVDQSHLLKEEIRRLQRNEERLNHVGHTEYLKNIIIKFLSPERVSGERQQLMPILSTMLQLSPEEIENLNRAAAQDDAAAVREPDNSWGSLLRWGRLS